jgi:hypothetical protein
MDRGRVVEERRGKEMDGCPLTVTETVTAVMTMAEKVAASNDSGGENGKDGSNDGDCSSSISEETLVHK